MTQIQSKQDVDRLRTSADARKEALARVKSILEMYRQGRTASSCMDEIAKAMKAVR
jgi:hypothetical protein